MQVAIKRITRVAWRERDDAAMLLQEVAILSYDADADALFALSQTTVRASLTSCHKGD
jgi:hypothetical protein